MNYFSKNLDFLKRRLRIRQNKIAASLHVAPSTVSNWIAKKSEPSIGELVKVVQFFGLSVEQMIYTDLEKTNAVTEEDVRQFQAGGRMSKRTYRLEDDSEQRRSLLNEPDVRDWTLLKLIKEMDRKLDLLLASKNAVS